MATKKINENPRITDIIKFDIETPGFDGCFTSNPYKVEQIKIYYLEKDFIEKSLGVYEKKIFDPKTEEELKQTKKIACLNPTEENLQKVSIVKSNLEKNAKIFSFYYKDAVPIKVVGSKDFPAWLSSDVENSLIDHIQFDEDNNIQYGKFSFEWNPNGSIREGNYVMCWTWTPNPAGDLLCQHIEFTIDGDPKLVATNPVHITNNKKYKELLDLYLAEVYKTRLLKNDITPETLYNFNLAVGEGFTQVENLANQLIDLFDANVAHETLLGYLSNLFNKKLRTQDPTLWRRQIKQAVPLYKRKGTAGGLKEALAECGINLRKISRLWQIKPKYTTTFSIKINKLDFNENGNLFFKIKGNIIWPPNNPNNFKLWHRLKNTDYYILRSSNHVNFYQEDGDWFCEWLGDELSTPIELQDGDILLLRYEKTIITNINEQNIEDYILLLPLMDKRDEVDQDYPPKNWMVHLISEDDPLFSLIITERHPFIDPLYFGKIRTEFPYSENVYNMDEYNGSTRDSTNPCDIDKEFIDTCEKCLSSTFDYYLDITNLSDDKIKEAKEIIRDYSPFHAVINDINFSGEQVDSVMPPVETIHCLISSSSQDFIISGNVNTKFHRTMGDEISGDFLLRDELTNTEIIANNFVGKAFNEEVWLFSPDVNLRNYGVDDQNSVLEILPPSMNAGLYSIGSINNRYAIVNSNVNEPLNEEPFTFRLVNNIYETYNASIKQDDIFELEIEESFFDENFSSIIYKNLNTNCWKVVIAEFSNIPYEILSINPNNKKLVLLDPDKTLPNSNAENIEIELFDENNISIFQDNNANLYVKKRGKLDLNDSNLPNVQEDRFIRRGDFVFYTGNEYKITGFIDNEIYLENYNEGNVGTAFVTIRRIVVENQVGQFGYKKIILDTIEDLESEFAIVNGQNNTAMNSWTTSSVFKENLLVLINNKFYKIDDINKNIIYLSGESQNFTTINNGGTSVEYTIYKFMKTPENIDFTYFNNISRTSEEVIERQDTMIPTFMALSMNDTDAMREKIVSEENISMKIEYTDGTVEEREI